jgi:hypothetical protein
MGWTTGRSRFDPRQRIFPLTSVSRPALRPTQPPVQWVPGVLSPGLKRGWSVTQTTHRHLAPMSRMSRSYASSTPKRLRGVWWDCFSVLYGIRSVPGYMWIPLRSFSLRFKLIYDSWSSSWYPTSFNRYAIWSSLCTCRLHIYMPSFLIPKQQDIVLQNRDSILICLHEDLRFPCVRYKREESFFAQ